MAITRNIEMRIAVATNPKETTFTELSKCFQCSSLSTLTAATTTVSNTIPQLSPPIPHSHSIYNHHHYQRKHQQGKKQSKTHLPWGCSSGPSVMVEAIHGRFYGSETEGDERKREEWRERDEAISTNPWQPKEPTKINTQSSIIHAQKSINDYPETARDEQGIG